MKSFVVVTMMLSLVSAEVAFAQSPAPAPSAPAVSGTAPAAPSSGKPALTGKRASCAQDARQLKGQDKKDQIEVCLSEARTDCLKQAIAGKAIGPARKDFVKTCMGGT